MTNQAKTSAHFARAIALIDAANAVDPNQDQGRPKELLYAERMSAMLARFQPDAAESLQLACRAQHICRWKIPRSDYPATRAGYLAWRTALYRAQAETASALLREAGYDEEMIERVARALAKRGLKVHAETQGVEDVAALVFIEHYLADFAAAKPDYSEEKWLDILRKTWKKMSPAAHEFALSGKLALPAALVPLIQKAVSG